MTSGQGLAEILLDQGLLEIGDYEFNDGTLATGKLNWDNIEEGTEGFEESASQIADIVTQYKCDLIVPIPRGANTLGQLVAAKAGLGCVLLEAPDRRTLKATERAAMEILKHERIALVDDITRTGGTLQRGTSLIPNVAVCTGVWDRSDSGIYFIRGFNREDIPVEAVIRRPVSLDGVIL